MYYNKDFDYTLVNMWLIEAEVDKGADFSDVIYADSFRDVMDYIESYYHDEYASDYTSFRQLRIAQLYGPFLA